jgi:hypothetical protein
MNDEVARLSEVSFQYTRAILHYLNHNLYKYDSIQKGAKRTTAREPWFQQSFRHFDEFQG